MQIIAHSDHAAQSPSLSLPSPKFEKGLRKNLHGFNIFRQSDLEDTGKTVYISHILAAKDLGIEMPESNSELPSLTIEEGVFLFDWFTDQIIDYYHFLFDFLGPYELIRNSFPDTKIYIISSKSRLKSLDLDITSHRLLMEIASLYGKHNVILINLDEFKSVLFKKIFFYGTHMIGSFVDNFYNFKNYLVSIPALHKYNRAIALSLKKIFPLAKTPNKKIFLSRLNYNHKLRVKREAFIKKYILNLSEDSFSDQEQFYIKHFKVDLNLDKDIYILNENILRPPTLEDEIEIENFFQNMGYEIVSLDNLKIAEQAYILSSATHVAGISGTAMGNTVFCNNRTKVLVLNTTDAYKFPHAQQSCWFGNDATEAPELDFRLNRWFSAKDIINSALSKKEWL